MWRRGSEVIRTGEVVENQGKVRGGTQTQWLSNRDERPPWWSQRQTGNKSRAEQGYLSWELLIRCVAGV